MNNLTVSVDTARAYMKDFQEGKFIPSISCMFESQRGYTGIDNSHQEFAIRTFESEEDCVKWLEGNSSKLNEKKQDNLPPLREWMTLRNLQDTDTVSDNTKYHAGIRYQLYKGENLNTKLVKTVYNPTADTMTFIFKTPATLKAHEPGYQPLIVDPHDDFKRKSNPSHNYTMMLQVLDFMKWLKETRPSNIAEPVSWKEIKDVLDTAYVRIWCNCLRGDVVIKLLDGRSMPIKDLVEEFKVNKDLWVYSTDEHGNFKPGKVTDVAQTGVTSEFVRVTLDNGKQIDTTPDHLYMTRDGSYKAACELQVGDSLMPLYFKENNGYEAVKHNFEGYSYYSVYKEVASSEFPEEVFQEAQQADPDNVYAIHHIDYNRKVAKIEYIQVEEEPVYDISVDKWNNFFVEDGVILHNCSSFHWFGKNYRASQFEASIYPTNIPDKKMRGRFGDFDLLCKHLSNLMKPNAIQFFLPQMASAAQKVLRQRGLI